MQAQDAESHLKRDAVEQLTGAHDAGWGRSVHQRLAISAAACGSILAASAARALPRRERRLEPVSCGFSKAAARLCPKRVFEKSRDFHAQSPRIGFSPGVWKLE